MCQLVVQIRSAMREFAKLYKEEGWYIDQALNEYLENLDLLESVNLTLI